VGTIDEGAASSWGPTAPDGGPTPEAVNVLAPSRAPDFTPQNSPCLRNCRYFMRVWSHFEVGNTAGCFGDGQEPRVQHLACTAQQGVHLELTADSPVLECNRWHPMSGVELQQIEQCRDLYYRDNPDHHPDAVEDDLDLEDDDGSQDDSD
jgi:hypothetical protein